MNKQEAIEQAIYLKAQADKAVSISNIFNLEVGQRFGKYKRGATVYFKAHKRRIYYTVESITYEPDNDKFLYTLQPVKQTANMFRREGIKEMELARYDYPI